MCEKCLKFVPLCSIKHEIRFPSGGFAPLNPLPGRCPGPQTPRRIWCLYFVLALATPLLGNLELIKRCTIKLLLYIQTV